MFKELPATLRIAFPLIISNMAQIALGLIDSAMIGAVDYKQLAASSLALNVVIIPQILGLGISIAITPLTAMANGMKDEMKASSVLFNGFILTALVAATISFLLIAAHPILFHLRQDAEVAALSVPFYKLIALSIIPALMFSAVKQFCDGLEFTKTSMTLALISLPLNACLNWIFIYGRFGFPRMELTGAGLGTLITRTVIAIILIIVVMRHRLFRSYIGVRKIAWRLNRSTWEELLHIGIPSGLQYGMEVAAFAVSALIIGSLGATPQAAHQIAIGLASATFMAASGFAMGGSIRVANAYGRNERALMRSIGTSTISGGLVYGCFCAILFIVFKNILPYVFTNNEGVAHVASALLVYAAIFQISDATQAIGVGLLRGVKDVKLPTLFVAIAYWLIGIPAGYVFAFRLNMGASGIWLGFVTGLTASSILLNSRFLKKV